MAQRGVCTGARPLQCCRAFQPFRFDRLRLAWLPQEELVGVVEDAGFDARLLGRGGDAGTARFHVDGMLCSSCSGKIEAALLAQPGVTAASVNLLTHRAEVRTQRNADLLSSVDLLLSYGLSLVLKLACLQLSGAVLHHSHQRHLIKHGSKAPRLMQVKFDPDVVGVRTLLFLVDQDLGYPARLEGEDERDSREDPSKADRRFWLRRFAWGGLFAVPTFLLAMVGAAPDAPATASVPY